jgi:preprotein translocase subunit SecB
MSDAQASPAYQLLRIYAKNMVFEQPNSPQILLERTEPEVDVKLGWTAEPVGKDAFEITVGVRVTSQINKQTLFALEAHQAGIFSRQAISDDALRAEVGMHCAQTVYPYLRATVSDLCTRAGFGPLVLADVKFTPLQEPAAKPEPKAAESRIPPAYAAAS